MTFWWWDNERSNSWPWSQTHCPTGERQREQSQFWIKRKFRLKLLFVPYIGHLLISGDQCPDPENVWAILDVQTMQEFVNYLATLVSPVWYVWISPVRIREILPGHGNCNVTKPLNRKKHFASSTETLWCQWIVTIWFGASEEGLGATLLPEGQPVVFPSSSPLSTEQKNALMIEE